MEENKIKAIFSYIALHLNGGSEDKSRFIYLWSKYREPVYTIEDIMGNFESVAQQKKEVCLKFFMLLLVVWVTVGLGVLSMVLLRFAGIDANTPEMWVYAGKTQLQLQSVIAVVTLVCVTVTMWYRQKYTGQHPFLVELLVMCVFSIVLVRMLYLMNIFETIGGELNMFYSLVPVMLEAWLCMRVAEVLDSWRNPRGNVEYWEGFYTAPIHLVTPKDVYADLVSVVPTMEGEECNLVLNEMKAHLARYDYAISKCVLSVLQEFAVEEMVKRG